MRRHVDFRAELLPLIFAEMQARYYIQAALLDGGDAESTEVRKVLAPRLARRALRKDRRRSRAAATGASTRPPTSSPGRTASYTSAADYQGQVYDMIEDDLTEALATRG